MNLLGAFHNGVSSLVANSEAMSTVSQNLANLRTVGYRRSDSAFATMLGGNSISGEATGGVRFTARPAVTAQGAIEATGRPYDLAISGDGLFVYGTEAVTGGGQLRYSRAGQLDGILPQSGGTTAFVGNAQGLFLMAWRTDATGEPVSTDPSALVPITASEAEPPADIGQATQTGTLDAVLPATGNAASVALSYFDADGTLQSLAATFTKTGPNAWTLAGTPPGGSPFSHALTFDGTGTLSSASTLAVGPFTLDVSHVSQRGTEFVKVDYQQDGLGKGEFVRYEVDESGIISGVFSNGAVRSLYRAALADFANPNALIELSGNMYTPSEQSGAAELRVASAERGTLVTGSVEVANVDLGDSFSKMIVTQRAYDSAAQVVRTVDEMTQTIRDLKR